MSPLHMLKVFRITRPVGYPNKLVVSAPLLWHEHAGEMLRAVEREIDSFRWKNMRVLERKPGNRYDETDPPRMVVEFEGEFADAFSRLDGHCQAAWREACSGVV